ncbi:hypothetical protein [Photobacterium rosenbergii]|uniref:Flp family type IVb pilin n=1 Tax=Photobacterium rosenbergii TaxID=294936 RepID=A0ABU3ZEY7_9GAMM|nr:hypothetical protein [Photobacterium rosenbergii]MDV5168676.1 hypothetical protein [Photobacterium rosenbergii]
MKGLLDRTKGLLVRLARDDKGASGIEYVLIAAVVVAAVLTLKDNIDSAFTTSSDTLSAAVSSANSTITSP